MIDKHDYKVTQAEFRGRTLQSLEDIKEDIKELKVEIKSLHSRMNSIKLVSSTLGAMAGFITSIGSLFVRKW